MDCNQIYPKKSKIFNVNRLEYGERVMLLAKELKCTFDTVASAYEKFRPGYVKELYLTLFDYIPIKKIVMWWR